MLPLRIIEWRAGLGCQYCDQKRFLNEPFGTWIGFGDAADLPFSGSKTREENRYAKETKQRVGLPALSFPLFTICKDNGHIGLFAVQQYSILIPYLFIFITG
jgi:hypothetical protein